MMKTAVRGAALFVGYGLIGFGGDYAVGLLAQNVSDEGVQVRQAPRVVVEVEPHVVVDVRSAIVSRVQVRHGGQCDFEVDRELTIPIAGVNLLKIDAGSGELDVEGQDGLHEIVAVGRVCASSEELLEELQLTVETSASGEVSLVAHYPEQRNWSGRNNTARIDLTVHMPAGLNVNIDDSSGGMDVSGTGDLTIDDSSGSIRVSNVAGFLHVDDSSGELEVRDVSGDVDIEDGSGGVDVRNVQGSLRLRDGSGEIDVAEVGHDVVIEADGSGSIEVRTVGGDFIVERDGSGSIRHSGVEGRVDVPVRRKRRGG